MSRSLSLQSRLLLLAIGTIPTTMTVTALSIQRGVAETVGVMLDAKMDAQIEAFASRSRALARTPEDAAFLIDFLGDEPSWGWRIVRDRRIYHGGLSFGRATVDRRHPDAHDGILAANATSATGHRLRVRGRRTHSELIEIAAPAEIMSIALQASLYRTLVRVMLVTLGLIAAAWLALSRVLRPLRALQSDVARIREGRATNIPVEQPPELKTLAAEINILLEQNDAGLANSRRHVANLAHGLKTPLATLALRQIRDGASGEAREIVADLGRRIDHHLGRARVAAFKAGGTHARTELADVVGKLIRVMRQLYRERALEITSSIAPDLAVAIDQQDLDEITGNLLDNACRHARERVSVACERQGRWVVLTVEDDGPGLTDHEAVLVLDAGVRLGEGARGHGLGLGICREIAELYGGRLRLGRSADTHGLSAQLIMPKAL